MKKDKAYYCDAIKGRLKMYSDECVYYDGLVERYERLDQRIHDVSASSLSFTPRTPSPDVHKKESDIAALDKLKISIDRQRSLSVKHKTEIEEAAALIRKADYRSTIEMRYIDGFTWNEIAEMLYGNKADFEDREETFVRRVFENQKKGIEFLAEYAMNEKKLPELLRDL